MARKNRKQKANEYKEKYGHIPLDYNERLAWMYDQYKITESKAYEIIQKRNAMISSLYYKEISFILYEEPEGSPRPRFRIINRSNLMNMAMSNSEFVHVYSLTGHEDNMHMKKLMTNEDYVELDHLLCTPCDLVYNTFSKTPSYYSKTDIFLAEIGLKRPLAKPDWDNLEKKYSDMSNNNIWIDDIIVIDGAIHKYYSILPRVEIKLRYLNMVYDKHQYNSMINRSNYDERTNLRYFGMEEKNI